MRAGVLCKTGGWKTRKDVPILVDRYMVSGLDTHEIWKCGVMIPRPNAGSFQERAHRTENRPCSRHACTGKQTGSGGDKRARGWGSTKAGAQGGREMQKKRIQETRRVPCSAVKYMLIAFRVAAVRRAPGRPLHHAHDVRHRADQRGDRGPPRRRVSPRCRAILRVREGRISVPARKVVEKWKFRRLRSNSRPFSVLPPSLARPLAVLLVVFPIAQL